MQLQELKKMYDACSWGEKSYTGLLEKREKLHAEIVNLQQVPEALKKELKELDHTLDLLEDQGEAQNIKQSLIEAIHAQFPESKEPYQRLFWELKKKETLEAKLGGQIALIQPFFGALKEGAAAKKMRSFLGILFGRNPKVVLARAIRKGVIEAERVYKEITDERLHAFLDSFLEEANRPWNSQLYRDHFYTLYDQFNELVATLEEERIQAKQRSLNIHKEIDLWIEKYCH